MKKTMIAVAVVAAAIVTHASTVMWGIPEAYADFEGSGEEQSFSGGTAFLFQYDAATGYAPKWNSQTGLWDLSGATLVALTLNGGETTYSFKNMHEDGYWGDLDDSNGQAGLPTASSIELESETPYAIVLTSEETTDLASFKGDDKFAAVMTGTSEYTSGFEESGAVYYYESMVAADGVHAGDWTQLKTDAVPEPTSGLLLLLGVAGLALKRKRA